MNRSRTSYRRPFPSMSSSTRQALVTLAVGLGFSLAFLGFAALASEMGDPWGVVVLVAIAPGMPFLGNRGDPYWPAVVACAIVWTAVGASVWTGVIRPIFFAGKTPSTGRPSSSNGATKPVPRRPRTG